MFTLLKNARLYAPESLGVADILIAGKKIAAIGKLADSVLPDLSVTDLDGRIVTPGLIDQHVHLIGGGGEAGFSSRTPEIQVSTIVKHGVTSVLGLLGTDSDTRQPATLFAKTQALNEEGISAWMLTGGYNFPSPTMTGTVRNDILYTKHCIGAKLAISDHRAPHISYEELIRLASDCRIAGMLSGKSGTMTIHLGNAPSRLDLLFRASKESAIPPQQFIPTHTNRHKDLFEHALIWAEQGGRIDITTGFATGNQAVNTLNALIAAREKGIAEESIAVSSDAQGSKPVFNERGELSGIGVAEQNELLEIIQEQVKYGYTLSEALKPVTSTVANWLKLPGKGQIQIGYDADLLILDDELTLQQTWAKGQCVFRDKKSLIHGMFE